ncbi:hypothetical protein HMPREF9056_03038 [Actinomyces sp. oral taxon 170 str. F0386]|nr:hypothetical protein HMPREF9056_03038 [Actinomyces sp. oral taxon 170 str. F0386]
MAMSLPQSGGRSGPTAGVFQGAGRSDSHEEAQTCRRREM